MGIDFLLRNFKENAGAEAVIWQDATYTYDWLCQRIRHWRERIRRQSLPSGSVVVLEADFSPNSIALLLTLVEHNCIVVPLTKAVGSRSREFMAIAQGEVSFSIDDRDKVAVRQLPNTADHAIYRRLREANRPGLVLFSSGSTGQPKAAVHDFVPLLEKFCVRRSSYRTITFLLYDHIGGVNTLLYTLSNAGCLVTVRDRSPDGVLRAVEAYRVELLPTSPTFLNLVLLSEAYRRYDLTSLKLVTYGTEPMPQGTLQRIHELFPDVRLLQTYGLSELGIMHSKSRSSDSLWVKIGGDGFETRIVDGVLQIRAKSAMLGYLNAPSPFTEDGWFDTQDSVEVDGEYIRVLGRKSEIINVGGEKVYPAEVENIIQDVESVREVTVYGEKNPITGQIVCARVVAKEGVEPGAVVARIKAACRKRLAKFKVPVKVSVVKDSLHSERFKKVRVKCP